MNKIIAALVGLMMLATPAFACVGPYCDIPNDGVINTMFSGSGFDVYFNDMVAIDECFDDDMIVENIYTMLGSVDVIQTIGIEDGWFWNPTEVILNAQISVDPFWFATANVETFATWDGVGSVYRSAELGDVTSVVAAGASEATFVDDIEYKGSVDVYKSIGLNTENLCYLDLPDMPDMPECTWCLD